jgi:hypothetical protein
VRRRHVAPGSPRPTASEADRDAQSTALPRADTKRAPTVAALELDVVREVCTRAALGVDARVTT